MKSEDFFDQLKGLEEAPSNPPAAEPEDSTRFDALFQHQENDLDDLKGVADEAAQGYRDPDADFEQPETAYEKAAEEFQADGLEDTGNMRPLSAMTDAEVYDTIYPIADVTLNYGIPLLAFGIEKLVNALPVGYYLEKKPDAQFKLTAKELRRITVAAVPVAKRINFKASPEGIFWFVLATTLIGAIAPNYSLHKGKKGAPKKKRATVGADVASQDWISTKDALALYPFGKDKLKALADAGRVETQGGGTRGRAIFYFRPDLDKLAAEG